LATDELERRLTAILAADVAGYSRLTGMDEEGTHVQLREHLHSLVDPKIAEHRGRIVKNTGDGLLAEFSSVVDAVRCAVVVQRGMAERNVTVPHERRIEFRIGINVGDIIVDRGDIFGDGVNIAARLEALADAGGIFLSDDAYRQVRGKLDIIIEDAGEHQLKNIARPVRVYQVRMEHYNVGETLSLPDKPSIAVLPFQNMSGDLDQEYFADGVVEDIISALSRMRWLFVIARNSSFTYKGRTVDVKQVGRELGVRYVLEGSVRRSANRVRITGQLIDTSTGTHLSADRFDGDIEDIFDLQDRITATVVGAIAPKLEQAEIERARRKPTESLDAYDYFLRAMACFYQRSRKANDDALALFSKAIEFDPNFATAYGMAAWCHAWRNLNGWMTDRAQEVAEGARLAWRAVELGRDDAVALARGGHALALLLGDLDGGAALIDRALALDPNFARAWYASGWVRVYRGEPEVAIEHLARAMRLSPLDPTLYHMQVGTAFAHMLAGRYEEASSWAERAFRQEPNYHPAAIVTAASNALAGRMEVASKAMEHLRQIDPLLRISNLKDRHPIRRPDDLARFAEGLRIAGLPEI
jgi:TolB-like protein